MSIEREISALKEQLENIKSIRYKAEARLEELTKQHSSIIAEIHELGIDPKNIEREIASLEQEIQRVLKETKEMLPKNLV